MCDVARTVYLSTYLFTYLPNLKKYTIKIRYRYQLLYNIHTFITLLAKSAKIRSNYFRNEGTTGLPDSTDLFIICQMNA